jgi:hypothetical protein
MSDCNDRLNKLYIIEKRKMKNNIGVIENNAGRRKIIKEMQQKAICMKLVVNKITGVCT